MAKVPENPCSIARTLGVIGERWTILILRDAIEGLSRFDDFRQSLGIAPDVLSARLATLVEHGVMQKTEYREHNERRRYAYTLTPAGHELLPTLMALQEWGDKHLPWPEGPSVLRHDPAGAPVHVGLIDNQGHEVPPEDLTRVKTDAYPAERIEILTRHS
ncbi:transcriptional regulator, HxlR family [Catenulispora acidiphila DSM 44928]|uniref:Transcriptional regulator, HxlR family n=1 Tax=Catenulispora acidiphila (strain DSM 44928 / JCM 14897 / NBRC 102108 / NRRL B-24433 / ID139908) TaxID=479433 RepID=C7Q4A9_CATAD|nr:helix-turn-helix domain-containing protein [Catenulispora acidiphila]ACU69969.1 transcriptional regulator, HxlR family [Catenulispora acidiphila DSM 44928]